MKKIITFIFLTISLNAAETSAFGAGSLDSDNPYGLSESEKIIFENKKQIRYQDQKISELTEQMEGMRSVVDSISSKLGKTRQRISEIDKQSVDIAESELEKIKSDINELKKIQTENYEKINSVLLKLSSMIDKIDSDYVTHSELKNQSVKKKPNKSKKKSKISNAQKLKDAVALYRKNYYTKALPIRKRVINLRQQTIILVKYHTIKSVILMQ